MFFKKDKDYMDRSAIILLQNNAGKVLLQLRDDTPTIAWPNYWGLPGGFSEAGELPEQTIRREVMEEISYTLTEIEEVGLEVEEEGYQNIATVYHASFNEPIESLTLLEGQALKYMSKSDWDTHNVIPFIRKILEQIA